MFGGVRRKMSAQASPLTIRREALALSTSRLQEGEKRACRAAKREAEVEALQVLQGKLADQAAAHAAELQSAREGEAAAQEARDAAHAAELAKLEGRHAETRAELERERETVNRLNTELADLEVESSMQLAQEPPAFEPSLVQAWA